MNSLNLDIADRYFNVKFFEVDTDSEDFSPVNIVYSSKLNQVLHRNRSMAITQVPGKGRGVGCH